jgi:GNAT superfamily N-acetyltransferase
VSYTVQQISDWLVRQGLRGADFESVVAGFCERLVAAGLPLARGMLAMRTLHPEIDAHSLIWQPGLPLQTESPTSQFVAASARGKGAGRALIEAVYAAADRRGADQVYWLTEETNAEARRLYDRVGVPTSFMKYRRP